MLPCVRPTHPCTHPVQILKNIRASVEPRNSVCHSATVFANSVMHCGTTVDAFLRENLDWLKKATNWAKFGATAGETGGQAGARPCLQLAPRPCSGLWAAARSSGWLLLVQAPVACRSTASHLAPSALTALVAYQPRARPGRHPPRQRGQEPRHHGALPPLCARRLHPLPLLWCAWGRPHGVRHARCLDAMHASNGAKRAGCKRNAAPMPSPAPPPHPAPLPTAPLPLVLCPPAEGGALYALGLIHTSHGQGVRQFLLDSLRTTQHEVRQ